MTNETKRTVCPVCKRQFTRARPHQVFCSPRCQQEGQLTRQGRPRYTRSSPAHVGATSELRACADLMVRGYEVFRALSPGAPCDLVAIDPGVGIPLRVEVKGGYRIGASTRAMGAPPKPENFDILAIVLADSVVYQPAMPPVKGEW